jgi:hypothetical protein
VPNLSVMAKALKKSIVAIAEAKRRALFSAKSLND